MDPRQNGNQAAFAKPSAWNPKEPSEWSCEEVGLTKREAFAMAAMQGLIVLYETSDFSVTDCAKLAVKSADVLLDELAKEPLP